MPPAARIGDNHVCPLSTGWTPHVGGPVSAGSSNVRIGGSMAARVGDMCVCIGPPDAIAQGSSTVRINGIPAARVGDLTVHGGSIVSGAGNVNIGG